MRTTGHRPSKIGSNLLFGAALALPGTAAAAAGQVPPGGASHSFLLLRWAALAVFGAHALRRRSLTLWIFCAMGAGAELGIDAPHFAVQLRVFSDIFLRLIQTLVAPLILATLITGIARQGNGRSVGRVAAKALIYFEVTTTLALVIGLFAINLVHAGDGIARLQPLSAHAALLHAGAPPHWNEFLLDAFPENLAKAVGEGRLLQVAVFAVLFGLAALGLSRENRAAVLRFTELFAEIMFRFTNIVMYLAPLGAGGAMAYTVGSMGPGILLSLARLAILFYAALIVFVLAVLLPIALAARIPVKEFLAAVAEPAAIAFATSSSEAALPRAMQDMEGFGAPRALVAFILPAGYSFNLAGSTLYLALASIFVAQAAGIRMPVAEQLAMMATLMLTSKGIGGVPRAVFVVLLGTAAGFHLPTEPILLILGIDSVMDMGRATINVTGNCLATAVIARWEGRFRDVGERSP